MPRRAANGSAGLTEPGTRPLGRVLVDVLGRVTDGPDLLGILVRDLRPEFLFETHDELDEIERVRVQVVDEGRFGFHLVLVHAELLDDDLLEALVRVGGHSDLLGGWARWSAAAVSVRW